MHEEGEKRSSGEKNSCENRHKGEGIKFWYTNADQFINKRDFLLARIADDEPDVIMITEVIPKSQANPIAPSLLAFEG